MSAAKPPPVPPALTAALAAMDLDDWRALPAHERRNLVAEAFHVFDEDAARELADTLEVDFDDCTEDIAKAEGRLN